MKFIAELNVMPNKNLLDPQGKAVLHGIHSLGISQVSDVRVGKRITLELEAASEQEAAQLAERAGKQLLANSVTEYFEVRISAAHS